MPRASRHSFVTDVPRRCFEGDAPKRAPHRRPEDAPDDGVGEQRQLVCAACGCPITTRDARREVNGRHEHSFVNPHGLAFHIGCFDPAPGCFASGEPTAEFTWFRGYRWQFASCRRCHTHLGWRFSAGAAGFFGLILDRLAETGDDE